MQLTRQLKAAGIQAGYSLIEVLITMFIIAIGLLGLVGLQARALNAEIESASRGQAMLLVNDLADRMMANLSAVKNPSGASTYSMAGTTFGTGYTNSCVTANPSNLSAQASCCASKGTTAEADLCEWDLALKGIGETSGGTNKIGAMTEARGCVFLQDATNRVYQIDVVWRGRDNTGAVPSDLTCGNTAITAQRRGVSRRFRVADLDGT